MKLCDEIKCTGCMACFNVCPTKAVNSVPDAEGFLRPVIDSEKCVECGRCIRVCPQIERNQINLDTNRNVYSCWLKNKDILRKSTSGGAFTALASRIISQNGSVYGAGLDDHLRVIHRRVTDIAGLNNLRGSKYVQSDIGGIYNLVKQDLCSEKKVLFTGTPCQVDALYHVLEKRYEGQLYTVDLVCHGVPSPQIYKDYLKYMGCKYNANPQYILFRNKIPGWYIFGMQIEFDNGQIYQQDNWHDPYHRGFLRNLYLRPSCHQCIYANTNRPSDITMADDWGYKEKGIRGLDNDQGISMVMINTSNGQELFDSVRKQMHVYAESFNQAVQGNPALSKPFGIPLQRERFWCDYSKFGYEYVAEKYCYPEEIPDWLKMRRDGINERRKEYIRHLPNRIGMKLVGDKAYSKLKELMKR